jgi:alkaline phosphatase D
MTEQTRRSLLKTGAATAGALAAGLLTPIGAQAAPLVRRDRPVLTHGVQSGDVTADSAIVWTRADRPSRMVVEIARDPSFKNARTLRGPLLTPETGGTGKLRIPGLPAGTELHYRVTADDGRAASEPLTGRFRTVPVGRGDARILWSGDVAGQGWGINPDIGGMTPFTAMATRGPDLFLHSGDTVYSDGPLAESVTLPDGRVWRNIVTPEKSKVAETLDEYRGQHAYNRLDENVKAFTAAVPSYVQWDDHHVCQPTTA